VNVVGDNHSIQNAVSIKLSVPFLMRRGATGATRKNGWRKEEKKSLGTTDQNLEERKEEKVGKRWKHNQNSF